MGRWRIGAACAAALGFQVWLSFAASHLVFYELMAIYALCAAVAIVRSVRASRRGAKPTEVIGSGIQGLGEVQDMYLGRLPVPPVSYSTPEGVVAEQVVSRSDPLDEAVWYVQRDEPRASSDGDTRP